MAPPKVGIAAMNIDFHSHIADLDYLEDLVGTTKAINLTLGHEARFPTGGHQETFAS